MKAVSSSSDKVLKIFTLASTSAGGKISGLSASAARRIRVGGERLLGALDRGHVVHPRRDLRGDLRVVHEVDHQLGRVLVGGALGDEHVVRPEHAALVRELPDERLLLGLLDDDVARPGHGQDDVARHEVLGVLIAGEGPHDPVVDGLLAGRDRRVEVGLRRRAWVLARAEHGQPDGVAHLGEERDLARPARVVRPQRLEAGELAGDGAVVAETGHAGLPRSVVVVGRIEVDALVDVLHVGDLVRHVGEVERLGPAQADQPRRPSSRSGRRCPSRCPGRHRAPAGSSRRTRRCR